MTEGGTGYGPFVRAAFPLAKVPVATKTGTGEVYGKQTTSWFASYAPANKPQYAVVMMVSQGGTGSGISGPSVAEIYKTLFGVNGQDGRPRQGLAARRPPDDRAAGGAPGRHRGARRRTRGPLPTGCPTCAELELRAYRRDEGGG